LKGIYWTFQVRQKVVDYMSPKISEAILFRSVALFWQVYAIFVKCMTNSAR
jgi:hypothetical protein